MLARASTRGRTGAHGLSAACSAVPSSQCVLALKRHACAGDGTNAGMIAGVAVAALIVVLFVLAALLLCCLFKRKQRQRLAKRPGQQHGGDQNKKQQQYAANGGAVPGDSHNMDAYGPVGGGAEAKPAGGAYGSTYGGAPGQAADTTQSSAAPQAGNPHSSGQPAAYGVYGAPPQDTQAAPGDYPDTYAGKPAGAGTPAAQPPSYPAI